MEKAKVYEQHEENKVFLEKLLFYKDEIKILQNRLDEVASKNSSEKCMVDLEHFQNQLFIQKNNIDEIKHLIHVDEDRLIAEVNKNEVAVDHRSIEFHEEEKNAMEAFEKVFLELRKEMQLFFTKWM